MRPAAIGSFQVERELGRGGMGEVYLAHDTKLDRKVAIKALPAHLAQDADRLARFQREAKVLASLNHPNIGAIYGFEESGGHHYLILEFVDGQTLAGLLKNGPLSLDEALPLAKQIAQALEVAHDKGIIHRDLKPGNVMVTPEGDVKVLDFGLARTADSPASSHSHDAAAAAPTMTSPALLHSPTIPGAIMGTAGYMSPEQARGKPVDKRSDIFSFGCVLYEMLTGAMPFHGETVADAIGATLHKETDLARLPVQTPATIRLLLARCLEKSRADRLHDIGDARIEIAHAIGDPRGASLGLSAAPVKPPATAQGTVTRVLAVAAVLLGVSFPFWSGALGLKPVPPEAPRPVVRFTIDPPDGCTIPEFIDYGHGIAINPAGDQIVFVAIANGKTHLCERKVSSLKSRLLPETEGCRSPFFSPDGKWLGFMSGRRLMKMPSEGGPAITLCEAPIIVSFVWLEDNTIVWTGGISGLWRVSANGGKPEKIASIGPDVKTVGGDMTVLGFDSPAAVPGADYMLATVWDAGSVEDYHLVKVSLADGSMRTLLRTVTAPCLIAPDQLLFTRGSTAMTVKFDPVQGRIIGEPSVALEHVRADQWGDTPYMGGSVSGTFAYVPGGRQVAGRRLIRVDEAGNATPLLDAPDYYTFGPVVSPDGRRILFNTLNNRVEVWTMDLDRKSKSLVTSRGENYGPVWSADGTSIFTQLSLPDKDTCIVRWPVTGGEPVVLPNACPVDRDNRPLEALPDGSGLVVNSTTRSAVNTYDLCVYRFGDASMTPLRDRPTNEARCRISADGKWIAYTSDESGREEVYVGPISAREPNVQVSTGGGTHPRFSRDGSRMFYIDPQQMLMSVALETTGPEIHASPPSKVLDCKVVGAAISEYSGYDPLPGGGFTMIEKSPWEKEKPVIHVILNWSEELKAR